MSGLPQCVVLGGGRGTRLGALTESMPKPMVPVAGRPFAVHQLEWLAGVGIERVLYSVGYLGDQLRDAVTVAGPALGLDVVVIDEQDRALGTAGALRFALDLDALEETFVLLYGDSLLDLDLAAVVDRYRTSEREALMTVCPVLGSDHVPNARVLDGLVVEYDKAATPERLATFAHIDYGVSVLRRSTIAERVPSGERADLSEVQHDLAARGRLAAFEVPTLFEEIGSPEGLARVRARLGETS